MTLQDMAFADLIAVGWAKEADVYKAINAVIIRNMSEIKIKQEAKLIRDRTDIKLRISETKSKIRCAGRMDRSESLDQSDPYSKESTLARLLIEANDPNATPSNRILANEKIATINGLKKEEQISDKDPVRIYAPSRCECCNLFVEALKIGKIKAEDADIM